VHKKQLNSGGNWIFQNKDLKRGQDTAGVIKEFLWNSFNPSAGKVAENNLHFLYQFLIGTGKDIQEHTDPRDPVLQDFKSSPGAAAIRAQYHEQACPAVTDRLNYGTYQAAVETLLPHREHPEDFSGFATTLPGDPPPDMVLPNLTSVAVQVGGFGKPPKEYPWANATATRCDEQGQPNPQGDHVQSHVVNIAGKYSFELHNAKDKPLGATGPERSIIQVFQWIEPIKPQEK
jgi:hypothetical protein